MKKYIKEYKDYDFEKEKLFSFLYENNDYGALKSLGAINPFGVREKWHVSSKKIRDYLNTRNDLLIKDQVKQFIEKLDRFEKSYMEYFITALVFAFFLLFLYTN